MEYSPETLDAIVQSSKYIGISIGIAISSWPLSKYVFLPIIDYIATSAEVTPRRQIFNSHRTTINSRENVMIKLVDRGHSPQDALKLTEKLFPFLPEQDYHTKTEKIFDRMRKTTENMGKPLEKQV